jgi:hypothetical protein
MKTQTTTSCGFKVGDKVAFKMGMGVWMVGTVAGFGKFGTMTVTTGKYGTFCVAPEDCSQ